MNVESLRKALLALPNVKEIDGVLWIKFKDQAHTASEPELPRWRTQIPTETMQQEFAVHHRRGYEAALRSTQKPIDVILFCPKCKVQHIDRPDEPDRYCYTEADGSCTSEDPRCMHQPQPEARWNNPPHRSHKCHACNHIWRAADVPTNGVGAYELKTKGKADSPIFQEAGIATEAQGYAVEAIHQFCPELPFTDDDLTSLTPAQLETVLRRMGWKPPSEQRPYKVMTDGEFANDVSRLVDAGLPAVSGPESSDNMTGPRCRVCGTTDGLRLYPQGPCCGGPDCIGF